MIVTSNRDTAEWIAMFDDVLLAQSAVDRFKNAAYDFVIEGESYRPRLKPKLIAADAPPAACGGCHWGREPLRIRTVLRRNKKQSKAAEASGQNERGRELWLGAAELTLDVMVASHCGTAKGPRFCRHRGLMQAETRTRTSSFPSVLLSPIAPRLRFAGGAAALMWTAYLILAVGQGLGSLKTTLIGAGALLGSVALVTYSVKPDVPTARLRAIGSLYLILSSFALAA
ncbi:MAG TPA: ATP-binding protein, partial [Polyangiaceae bacterium]